MEQRPVICFVVGSAGDWGGASRAIFTLLRRMTFERMEPLILLPRGGPIQKELEERGLRYFIWGSFTEPGSVPKYCRAYWRTVRFLRRERVRVLHVNSHVFWRPAELLAAYTLRIPIIAHYHVINDTPAPFMTLCRAAVSNSRYTAEQSLPAGLAKPVIYYSIDLDRFDAGISLRGELGLTPADVVVSFLGQIRDIKGVQDFIAMARRIRDPRARFLIAGECRDPKKYPGSYTVEDLESMIGKDNRIRYVDYVSKPEYLPDVRYHRHAFALVRTPWADQPRSRCLSQAGSRDSGGGNTGGRRRWRERVPRRSGGCRRSRETRATTPRQPRAAPRHGRGRAASGRARIHDQDGRRVRKPPAELCVTAVHFVTVGVLATLHGRAANAPA